MLFMGKSTISMAIYHSFLYAYQRVKIDALLPGAMCGTGGDVQPLHVAGGGSMQMGENTEQNGHFHRGKVGRCL